MTLGELFHTLDRDAVIAAIDRLYEVEDDDVDGYEEAWEATLNLQPTPILIRHVGYHPDQPWPAAKALGWGVGEDSRGPAGWDHRCPECLANQNEPMDVVGDDPLASSTATRFP
jgi:hypothetical protein